MSDEVRDSIHVEVSDQEAAPTEEVAQLDEQEATGADSDSPDEVEDHGDEAGDESEQQDDDHGGDDVPYGVKKKLGKLTARVKERDEKLAARDAEIQQAREELEFLRKSQAPQQKAEEAPFPTLSDADFDQSKHEQMVRAWTQSQATVQAHKLQEQQAQELKYGTYCEKVKGFAADKPDWAEKTARIPTTDVMLDVIQDMDGGPAVTYYLAQHLNEAIDISRMPAHKAAIALARIEGKVASTPAVAKKTITGAPAPIKTLGTASPVKKDLVDLPMSEYIKERNKSRKSSGGFL